MSTIKQALNELLKVAIKHGETLSELVSVSRIQARIKIEELSTEFNIPIQYESNPTWIQLRSDNEHICFMDGKTRKVSYSDDGRQPEDENLYQLHFPCGGYTFTHGSSKCPSKTFMKFFNELKAFSPSYIDTCNHCLYFSADVARTVYDAYQDIFEKYAKEARKELATGEIENLKSELERLESL